MKDNPHSGHRERLRQRFAENGITEHTPDHEILEFLLFYSIPRINTNDIAHRLIDRFGSLAGVFEASEAELLKVEGIGKNSAVLIKSMLPIMKKYMSSKNEKTKKFSNVEEVGDFLLMEYLGFTEEVFAITLMDGQGKFLGFKMLEHGDIGSVGVSTRKVIQAVLETNACCAVISHNHPGGVALPSAADLSITESVKTALDKISVRLLDHIIIADGDYVSMAQTPKYKILFRR